MGFPHSDIFGSKVARHLPEAYRRHAASFIAFSSQGIHHTPLNFPLGNLKTATTLHGSLFASDIELCLPYSLGLQRRAREITLLRSATQSFEGTLFIPMLFYEIGIPTCVGTYIAFRILPTRIIYETFIVSLYYRKTMNNFFPP